MSLAKTACGIIVHETYDSHNDVPLFFVKEAIRRISNPENLTQVEVQFDTDIGLSLIADTDENDLIVYARRPNTQGYSRFAKGKRCSLSRTVTITLERISIREAVLISSWIGNSYPPEPWDKNKTLQSLAFWSRHAFIWGQRQIIPGTETDKCPW